MAQGVVLAAAAVLGNSLLGRSYWAILGTLCGAVMQRSLDPLLYNRASLQYEPMASMPLGNLQHVALVPAVSNTMFGFMHLGQVMQAGFTCLHAALAQGSLFSGTGDSNPFLDDIRVHLPSTSAAVGAAVNTGFWMPVMLLAAGVLFPGQAFRASVWCGAGRRPALDRLMASHLQTGEFGDKTFDPQAPNSQSNPSAVQKKLLKNVLAGVQPDVSPARPAANTKSLQAQQEKRRQLNFGRASIRQRSVASTGTGAGADADAWVELTAAGPNTASTPQAALLTQRSPGQSAHKTRRASTAVALRSSAAAMLTILPSSPVRRTGSHSSGSSPRKGVFNDESTPLTVAWRAGGSHRARKGDARAR